MKILMNPLEELIAAARCELEVDLLLEGGKIANVLSGEVHKADVAIHKGRITGFDCSSARATIDLNGKILTPGFIDGHVHIESSMVTVPEYARAVVPRGTTSVVIDPHEIANVWGEKGIRYMLDSSRNVPLNVFVMLPSCVPATNMETSGATLDADILSKLMVDERVLGLAEVMNYPGVIFRDPEVLKKIRVAGTKRVDGHAPGLKGRDLTAYIAAGIKSDHESTSLEEAREKLRQGMYIMLREGSAAKNLRDLLPLVTPLNARQFHFRLRRPTSCRHPLRRSHRLHGEDGHRSRALIPSWPCRLPASMQPNTSACETWELLRQAIEQILQCLDDLETPPSYQGDQRRKVGGRGWQSNCPAAKRSSSETKIDADWQDRSSVL